MADFASTLPLDLRVRFYQESLDLSSLNSLSRVSHQFRIDIWELIFKPTLKANNFCLHSHADLDQLLAHTIQHGRNIKILNVKLSNAFENSSEESKAQTTLMIISILNNCHNLARLSLKYGYEGINNDHLFNEFNTKILPELSYLETLTIKDVLTIGWKYRDFKPIESLNVNPLNRLKLVCLNRFDFNESIVAQIEKLSEKIFFRLTIECQGLIPEFMSRSFERLQPNCKLFWDLSSYTFCFPEKNLLSIQKIKCHQEVFIMFRGLVNIEQLLLLKPFKCVKLVAPGEASSAKKLEERIKNLLPNLNIIVNYIV
jgi:hypothetical protein